MINETTGYNYDTDALLISTKYAKRYFDQKKYTANIEDAFADVLRAIRDAVTDNEGVIEESELLRRWFNEFDIKNPFRKNVTRAINAVDSLYSNVEEAIDELKSVRSNLEDIGYALEEYSNGENDADLDSLESDFYDAQSVADTYSVSGYESWIVE